MSNGSLSLPWYPADEGVRGSAVGWGTALQTGRSRVRFLPIPVAARCKAWACGRSLAGVAGSNFAGSMDVCVVY